MTLIRHHVQKSLDFPLEEGQLLVLEPAGQKELDPEGIVIKDLPQYNVPRYRTFSTPTRETYTPAFHESNALFYIK